MDLIDIGYGLRVGLKKPNTWQVLAKNGCFDMVEMSDFFRVVTLLEHPYSDMVLLLNARVDRASAPSQFPFWKVVGAGLASKSDQWASLALDWFPSLEDLEKTMLASQLTELVQSKWASQRSRQLAERYLKQIRVDG